jgi:hypothetical protein
VKPLTEPEIRAAFVNCTEGEAKRLNVPRDLAEQPWDDLDFTNLACSLYLRGKKPVVGLGGRFKERLTLEEKIERTMASLAAFVDKVTS